VEFLGFGASTSHDSAPPIPVPTTEERGRSSRRPPPSLQHDRGLDRDGDGNRDRNNSIRTRWILFSVPELIARPFFPMNIPSGSGSNSTTASSTMATTGSQSPSRLEPVLEGSENSPTIILRDDGSESTHALSLSPLEFDLELRNEDEPGVEIDGGGVVDSDSSSVMSEMSLHTAPADFDSESLRNGEP